MEIIRRFLCRALSFIEFFLVYTLGKIFGISMVVRYLRNPNPIITVRLLRSFGASIGEKTTIKRSLIIDNAYEDKNSKGDFSYMKIGNNCYIGDCVYFDLTNEIILGDNVVISGKVMFLTHMDCNRSVFLAEKYPRMCQPVRVNDGAWIGFMTSIFPGITVGSCSLIASHSLLKESVDQKTVYAGIPAKKIKGLND